MSTTRKTKSTGPSLRDKLSQNFLRAFEADFETHGAEVIEQLRQKSPKKYSEIAARLIAATEPKPEGFESCKNMQDIGRKLLQAAGVEDEDKMTDAMIQAAIDAQLRFNDELAKIAEQGLH